MVIKINVTNKRAVLVGSPVIVCGNSGYTLEFTFDAEWSAESVRTARFVYVRDGSVQYQDVVFSGTTAQVPVLANIKEVRVGVFAGDLHTSTPALIPCERSIRCGTGAPEDPTPSQYDQIMALLSEDVVPHAAQHRAGGSDPLTAADVGARPNTWMPTAADVGAFSSKGYITDNTNIDNLADGVYEYNGWASDSIVCSAGVPFVKAFGTWIKKTPYDDKSTANRIDTVINNYTGDVYTMYGYNGTWYKNTANSVNKAGDTMKGNLTIESSGYNNQLALKRTAGWGDVVASFYRDDGEMLGAIGFDSNGSPLLRELGDSSSAHKTILHTGNKPSGSYTGNGEATARTVDIGGIGNILFIRAQHSVIGFACFYGGVMFNLANNTTQYYTRTRFSFADGVLTIATSDAHVNNNGTEFYYQVL